MTSYLSLALAILSVPMMATANTPGGQTAPGQVTVIVRPVQIPHATSVSVPTANAIQKVFGNEAGKDAITVFGTFADGNDPKKLQNLQTLLEKGVNDSKSGQELRQAVTEIAKLIRNSAKIFAKTGAQSPGQIAAILRETALDLFLVATGPGLEGNPDLDVLIAKYAESRAIVNFAEVYHEYRKLLSGGERSYSNAYAKAFESVMGKKGVTQAQIKRALQVVSSNSCGVPVGVSALAQ